MQGSCFVCSGKHSPTCLHPPRQISRRLNGSADRTIHPHRRAFLPPFPLAQLERVCNYWASLPVQLVAPLTTACTLHLCSCNTTSQTTQTTTTHNPSSALKIPPTSSHFLASAYQTTTTSEQARLQHPTESLLPLPRSIRGCHTCRLPRRVARSGAIYSSRAADSNPSLPRLSIPRGTN